MDRLISQLVQTDGLHLLGAFAFGLWVYHQYNMPKIQEALRELVNEKSKTIETQQALIKKLDDDRSTLQMQLDRYVTDVRK